MSTLAEAWAVSVALRKSRLGGISHKSTNSVGISRCSFRSTVGVPLWRKVCVHTDWATSCLMEFGSVPPGLARINWVTPTPPLPFDSASEDAKALEVDVFQPIGVLTPAEEICSSSALCLGSGEVPNYSKRAKAERAEYRELLRACRELLAGLSCNGSIG